ncbi:hypothetical protein [Gemmata sp.]|uniref:hypothetical protein n=1 Tax=Gemmata sp. TaxID=1914242 RepID=UPI003F714498
MRLASALLLCGLVAHAVAAAPPAVVEVPRGDPAKWAEVRAERGRILRLSAEPASKWLLIDDAAADLFPADGGKIADFATPTDGRYKLVVTAPDGSAARVVVVVGDGPAPDKKPADPLVARLRAAYDADPERDLAKRQAHAKDLAAVYGVVAKAARNPDLGTAKAFIAFAKESATKMVDLDAPDGVRNLAGVRDVVAKDLAAIFPGDGPLTDDQRRAAAELFTKLAAALEAF